MTDDLAAPLAALLGATSVTDVTRLSGVSRDTFRFVADGRALILQRQRAGDVRDMGNEALVLRAAAAHGVPVPELIAASSSASDLGAAYMVLAAVEGETIARKILRDDEYRHAREVLPGQLGAALAQLHSIDTSGLDALPITDQVQQYRDVLDQSGQPHPTFELAFKWLHDNRPAARPPVLVHGDFRLGNVIVGDDGLRAVLDWELAHRGDPMEDLGWLCVKAWRFGAAQPVAGVGAYEQLFEAYEAAGGGAVDPHVVRWWEVLGTLKWGIMCIMQASAHTSGVSRSHELAAIGRRVCENEHDLFLALGGSLVNLHDMPSAEQLVEAVREWLERDVMAGTTGRLQFHARVAVNVLSMVERELRLGAEQHAEHVERLAQLGCADDTDLAQRIRDGELDDRLAEVREVVWADVRAKLAVANPKYLA